MSHLEYGGVVVPTMRYIEGLSGCKAVNVHGSVYTERGTPDIVASIRGRFVALECKRSPDEQPSQIQDWRLREWRSAGAVAECVGSFEEARAVLDGVISGEL